MGLFYLPRLIWKSYEGGVMKLLTSGLTGQVMLFSGLTDQVMLSFFFWSYR
jgi:hypothetical protein